MKPRYLYPKDYYADPSANVFNGKLYVYPSHDWEAGAAFDDNGGHFQMKDYHVISMEDVERFWMLPTLSGPKSRCGITTV